MFLTIEDMQRLTGCKRKADQCRYLDAQFIPYRINARGAPIVTIAYINGLKESSQKQPWQPSLKLV